MKTIFTVVGCIAVVAVLGLAVAGCSNGSTTPDPDPWANYYGTWGDSNIWYIISPSKIGTYFTENGQTVVYYVIENLTWTECINGGGAFASTHPTGYSVTGKLTYMDYGNNGSFNPETGSMSNWTEVGPTVMEHFYISNDGQSISVGTYNKSNNFQGEIIYLKK